MKKVIIATLLSVIVSGCATKPENIAASHTPVTVYKDYTCDQIIEEIAVVSDKVNTLHKSLKSEATKDTWQAAGAVIFWPMLFALEGGDGVEATEYSKLKGQYEALESASKQKQCKLNKI